MTDESKNRGRANCPLWIIAISLLAIAVCLVLLVARVQRAERPAKPVIVAATTEEQSRPPNRFFSKPHSSKTDLSSQAKPAVALSPPQSGYDASITLLESTAIEEVSASGGIIAPLAALANTNISAAIVGHVSLRGQPPPELPIKMSGDAPCARLQTNTPTTRHFIVGPDGGLADVLVSITGGLDRKRYAIPPTNQMLSFANCQIQPFLSAVGAGQWLLFTNADPVLHKVLFTPTNNPPVNFTLRSTTKSPLLRFSKPEFFARVRCEVHPWEFAYVSVVEHPFFALTDTNGDFVIPDVPPGKYKVRALHRKAQSTNEMTHEVTVSPGEISLLKFTLDVPQR